MVVVHIVSRGRCQWEGVGNKRHRLVLSQIIYQAISRVVLHFVVEAGDAVLERHHLLVQSSRDGSCLDQVSQVLCDVDQLLHHDMLGLLQGVWQFGHDIGSKVDKVYYASRSLSG